MTYDLPIGKDAVAFENLTVSTSAVPLTAATYGIPENPGSVRLTTATEALISVEAQPVRWTIRNGTTVDASSNGHLTVAADVIHLKTSAQIVAFRAIRTGGSDATLRVTYFR